MKTLIAYAGKGGTTAELVQKLGNLISGDVEIADLKTHRAPDPSGFDAVVVGGSIHAGSIHKSIRRFCEEHKGTLQEKRLGLFLTSLQEEEVENNFTRNFPAQLREHASICSWLGGRFIFSEHSFIIRGMMKKIMGTEEDVESLRWDELERLAAALSSAGEGAKLTDGETAEPTAPEGARK